MNKFRLDLTEDELITLRIIWRETKILKQHDQYKSEDSYKTLDKMIAKPKIIMHSDKKSEATRTATEARSKKAKLKIENAINILKLYNKKITIYRVAKEAGISYNTVL